MTRTIVHSLCMFIFFIFFQKKSKRMRADDAKHSYRGLSNESYRAAYEDSGQRSSSSPPITGLETELGWQKKKAALEGNSVFRKQFHFAYCSLRIPKGCSRSDVPTPGSSLSCYRFPYDGERRNQWMTDTRLENFAPYANTSKYTNIVPSLRWRREKS